MLKRNKFIVFFAMFFAISFDIFFLKGRFDFLVLFIMVLWLFLNIYLKIDKKVSFIIALICLFIGALFTFIEEPFFQRCAAERALRWFYLFLFFGISHSTFSLFGKNTT